MKDSRAPSLGTVVVAALAAAALGCLRSTGETRGGSAQGPAAGSTTGGSTSTSGPAASSTASGSTGSTSGTGEGPSTSGGTSGSTSGCGATGWPSGVSATGSTSGGGVPDCGPVADCTAPGDIRPCACSGIQTGAEPCQATSCTCNANGGTANGAVIAGTATLPGGLDPSGIAVAAEFPDSGAFFATSTDADGGYAFGGLAPDTAYLAFRKEAALPPASGFAARSDGGVATLDYGARIPGVLIQPDGGVFVEGADGSYPLAPIELAAGLHLPASNPCVLIPSPDGCHFAFLADGDCGHGTLELGSIGGGPPTAIATDAAVPQFSPDGSHLAYLAGAAPSSSYWIGALELFSIADGSSLQLGTGVVAAYNPGPISFSPDFSPDGSHVAFIGGASVDGSGNLSFLDGGYLMLASVTGGGSIQLATGVSTLPSAFQFSPDGRYLAFLANGALQVVPVVGGSPMQVATNAQWLQYSPDGTHLAYLAGPYDNVALYVASGDGSGSIRLASGAWNAFSAPAIRFSPDGAELAFLAGQGYEGGGQLYLADVSGGPPVQVAPDAFDGFQFTPDGRHLIFLSNMCDKTPCGLTVATLPCGDTVELTASGDWFRLSPDGRWLAFEDRQVLSIDDLSTGITRQIGTATEQAVFSPDGSHIAFLDPRGGLFIVATAGGSSVEIALNAADFEGAFGFSPDGSRLAIFTPRYTNTAFTGPLQVVEVSGTAPVVLNEDVSQWAFAGNGALVALRAGSPAPFGFQDGAYVTLLP